MKERIFSSSLRRIKRLSLVGEPKQAEGEVFRDIFIRSSDCGEGEEAK